MSNCQTDIRKKTEIQKGEPSVGSAFALEGEFVNQEEEAERLSRILIVL